MSPQRSAKKQKTESACSLFRGAELNPTAADSPSTSAQDDDGENDPVFDELKRWEGMGSKEYSKFVTKQGLLNEFAMMWALRETFPLHYVVFKQTACHILHEANVEQIFSRAGLLANARLDPSYLALLVRVGFNKKSYKPTVRVTKEKYYDLFRGKEEDLEGAPGSSSAGAT